MPIFQDPDRRFSQPDQSSASLPQANNLRLKTSEESIRTEFCDGFLPDVPPLWKGLGDQPAPPETDGSPQGKAGVCTSDRNELMERIKRGESPTWVPSQTLKDEFSKLQQEEPSFTPPSISSCHEPNALLPSAELPNTSTTANDRYPTELSPPLDIKRPRSALHAGDFTRGSHTATSASQHSAEPTAFPVEAFTGAPPTVPRNILPQTHWNGGIGRNLTNFDHEPSPYVGHIDLSQLPAPAESKKTRRSRSKSPPVDKGPTVSLQDQTIIENEQSAGGIARGQKKRRRVSPPPSGLQGGYRIPQKGQLQIVIKNPNKTAVKLFLVPYDLEDMPGRTKTFIRQRCYLTDPVIDGLPSQQRSESGLSFGSSPSKGKPTLRYLIHLNICSPSSGRYYLYQTIRVVFANRVPDNKEQLQTEIHTPQPRYSAYIAGHSLSRSVSSSSAGFAREKTHRRRSSGFGIGNEGTDDVHPRAFAYGTNHPSGFGTLPPPVPGIPRQFSSPQTPASPFSMDGTNSVTSVGKHRTRGDGRLLASPTPAFPATSNTTYYLRENQRPAEDESVDLQNSSRPTTSSSQQCLQSPSSDKTDLQGLHGKPGDISHSSGETSPYGIIGRWDAEYDRRPVTPVPRTGLLTKKLKGLGVQMKTSAGSDDEMDE
ncbi:MAG: hypothetical protein Q9221_001326 [Calogaya cf. arnoldii]